MTDSSMNLHNGPIAMVQHYLHILLKWKWIAVFFFVAVVGGATLFSFLIPPIYTSKGSIWIEEQLNILPFEDIQRPDNTGLLPPSYSQLLQSRALAAKVIDKLKLFENLEFAGKPPRGEKLADPSDPIFRERLIENFLKRISVRPIERTKLLEVTFSDRDPKFASETLNALFDEYIDMIIRQRYETSERATEFLKIQIATVRSEIEESEKKLSEYGTSKNILPLSASEAPTVAKLSEVNKAVTDATIDRVTKYDRYNQLKAGIITELAGSPIDSPVRRLNDQLARLSQEYAKRLGTLRPEYPEMQRLKSEIDSVKEDLQNESKKMIDAAYADYQAALKKEYSLQGLLEKLRTDAFKANSNSIVYNSQRIELENKKALLESLSKRQSETDLSAQLKSLEAANIWVVDKANFPLRPMSPNKRRNVLLGFLAGLAGAVGLALMLEYLNNTVKTSKDITNSTGFPILGSIPAFDIETNPKGPKAEITRIIGMIRGKSEPRKEKDRGPKRKEVFVGLGGLAPQRDQAGGRADQEAKLARIELIASREPQSIQAESYRSVRTTLLVSAPPGNIKSILITSPLAREGKSATVANLGLSLAQANKRVVMVDSDLRKPRLSRIFGPQSGSGLTHYVSSRIEAAELVKPTPFPHLYLISSGPIPANPIELLTSEKMVNLISFLKQSFDYILFDTPPLLAVSDAVAMGPMIDGVILVARGGQTPIPALKQAKQKLDTHNIKCIGVILNGVDLVEQDGYYAKQYYNYSKHE
jgi:succinoglycan biosynthesis transport protein ExoP